MKTMINNNSIIHHLPKTLLLLVLTVFFTSNSFAQSDTLYNKHIDDLNFLKLGVVEADTLPTYRLDTVSVASNKLMTPEELKAYKKLKYNIIKVYPYAQRALNLIAEIEAVTEESKKKKETRVQYNNR